MSKGYQYAMGSDRNLREEMFKGNRGHTGKADERWVHSHLCFAVSQATRELVGNLI
jgi:sarcosine oxidase delta subunit